MHGCDWVVDCLVLRRTMIVGELYKQKEENTAQLVGKECRNLRSWREYRN